MSSSSTTYQEILVPNLIPSPKQTLFLSSPAYETFFGGAAGPGKSAALCAEAVTACLEDEGHHTYIFRKTIPELKQSIVPEIKKQCAAYLEYMPYNSQDRRFNFANGSFIQLAYCDNPGDYYRYQSAEIHTLLFDELTHFTQDEYEYLKTRVRSVEPRKLRVMSASNPGNIGHGWVKSYFVDVGVPDQLYMDPETGKTRMFIPASIEDHPIESFRQQYRQTLAAIPDPALRKALLEGDWNIFAGQVFNEWRREKHVIDRLPVNLDECKRYVGLDWGYNDPTAIYWVAQTPEGEDGRHYYVYRELYANSKRPEDWAYELALYLKQEPVEFLAMPHDTYANQGGTRPIVDQFREVFDKLNVRVSILRAPSGTKADKLNRQALMHHMLGPTRLGKPIMQVMDTCQNLIRTLPMLVYSDTRPEEIADKMEDHCLAGDTPVLTINGWVRLDSLAGAKINGYNALVVDLETVTGEKLTCTLNHKIATPYGWKEAQELIEDSEILWFSPIDSNNTEDKHTGCVVSTFSAKDKGYIEKSGATIIKKQSQRDTIFITSTKTGKTIPLPTLNSVGEESTSPIILPHPLTNSGPPAQEMPQDLVEKGIAVLRENNAVKRLKKVGKPYVLDKVYDITILNGVHAFIANGFITSNSYDGLSYVLYTIARSGGGSIVRPKPPEGSKLKAPIATEQGLYDPQVRAMMEKAVKDSMRKGGRDWRYN